MSLLAKNEYDFRNHVGDDFSTPTRYSSSNDLCLITENQIFPKV